MRPCRVMARLRRPRRASLLYLSPEKSCLVLLCGRVLHLGRGEDGRGGSQPAIIKSRITPQSHWGGGAAAPSLEQAMKSSLAWALRLLAWTALRTCRACLCRLMRARVSAVRAGWRGSLRGRRQPHRKHLLKVRMQNRNMQGSISVPWNSRR